MEKRVSVFGCDEYEYGKVYEAVKNTFDAFGGVDCFVKPGMNVLVKPNLIMRKTPESAATTHPDVLRAVIELCQSAGGIVTIADSPGGLYNPTALKSVYKGCGIEDVANKTGAKLNYNTTFSDVVNENAQLVKSFPIITPVTKADIVINVCKLKTHMMANYSGGVKNLFGVLPGTYKAEYHFRMSELDKFCTMLCDLCDTVNPAFTVMDAIYGMEGEGPTNGTPKKVGCILGAANPYALDLAGCKIIDIDPKKVNTVKIGMDRGYIPERASELELLGDNLDSFVKKDYKKVDVNKDIVFIGKRFRLLRKVMEKYLRPYPVFDSNKCIKCRRCIDNCPAKCLDFKGDAPKVEKKDCIRCFCCHELCPEDAVRIKKSKILNIANKL